MSKFISGTWLHIHVVRMLGNKCDPSCSDENIKVDAS